MTAALARPSCAGAVTATRKPPSARCSTRARRARGTTVTAIRDMLGMSAPVTVVSSNMRPISTEQVRAVLALKQVRGEEP